MMKSQNTKNTKKDTSSSRFYRSAMYGGEFDD